MLEFANPIYLYALSGLLLLAAISFLSYEWRRRRLRQFAPKQELRDLVMPERIGRKRLTRDALLLGAVALILIALARPQSVGKNTQDQEQRGIELMLCIDVSNSMLSTDIAPSRMSFTKRMVARLVEQRPNDRIGIIIFAANAYVQLPITGDHTTALEFLQDVSPQMLTAQGTNIGEAIGLAQSAFSDKQEVGKAIVVFTDVEDQEEGALEAAEVASKAGIKVHVVGVGTLEGGTIPMADGYLKDDEGNVVTTRLGKDEGMAVAQAGSGSFISSTVESEVLSELQPQLDRLPKVALGAIDRTGYIELYAPWVAGAIVLLVLESFIAQRRNRLWRRYNIFRHEQ